MINLFDLSTGMAGSKKAFQEGSIGGKNRSIVANKLIDPVEIHTEDKPPTYEPRKGSSVKGSSTTPMKMLIAQEMSKEMDCKRKTPNVIARLMGLDDAPPGDSSAMSSKRNLSDGDSLRGHLESRGLKQSQHQRDEYFDQSKPREFRSNFDASKDYRDVYEVRQPPSRHSGNLNDRRMALVREKFIEAKRLATDEKLLESKEFHDALEVLSSNRDLFLKFLEEPNSLFSSQVERFSIPPQTKRITVLKPSKSNETKSLVNQHCYGTGSGLSNTFWNSSFAHYPTTEKLSQPTRIVVLKPSSRKHLDIKSPATPVSSSQELSRNGNHYGGRKTHDFIHSNEAVKDTKSDMPESLGRLRRDESLLSSVFSNGYIGDDSSFHKSENYAEEDDCNNSDSEIVSSWDYTSNRYGSPYSHSSFSRVSYSPESSLVIREAKKRLSERWALVASNELYQEKLRGRRSSSTLGEMLAINELRMENRDDKPIDRTKEEGEEDRSSIANLSRSKSVPTSSSTYENIGMNTQDFDSRTNNSVINKESAKSRSGKTSFKGRVSSLFFLKNKKSCRDESVSSSPLESSVNGLQTTIAETVDNLNDNSSQGIQTDFVEADPVSNFEGEFGQIYSPVAQIDDLDESKISPKTSLSHEELQPPTENSKTLTMPEKLSENQDHPSPTSILDVPFKDDLNENAPNSSNFTPSDNPQALSRSSPIESIARTLSWDNSCVRASLPVSFDRSRPFCNAGEDDLEDLKLVQNLLTASGLYKNRVNNIFNGWHSLEIPMDPNLLDKLPDVKDEAMERLNQKLIFDCVNVVLKEIGHSAEQNAYRCGVEEDENLLAIRVWPVVKKRLSGGCKLVAGEVENGGGLMVDRLIGGEVAGSEWTEWLRSEISGISQEIGVQVLDDLVEEALVGLTDC